MSEERAVLVDLVTEAVRLGADGLEVEYDDGHEEVTAFKGNTGVGIARFPSGSVKAIRLRTQLEEVTRRKRRVRIGDLDYELRGRQYDSFGEAAFFIKLRRLFPR
jgi:hypothetical protein